jgi:hypothetical protein
VARIVFVVDGNAVLFNRARINNWQQAHVDFRTAASGSCASAMRAHAWLRNRALVAFVIGQLASIQLGN